MELDGFLRDRKCTTSRIPAWAKCQPGIENLHDIEARRKLPNEVAHCCSRSAADRSQYRQTAYFAS